MITNKELKALDEINLNTKWGTPEFDKTFQDCFGAYDRRKEEIRAIISRVQDRVYKEIFTGKRITPAQKKVIFEIIRIKWICKIGREARLKYLWAFQSPDCQEEIHIRRTAGNTYFVEGDVRTLKKLESLGTVKIVKRVLKYDYIVSTPWDFDLRDDEKL